MKLVINFKWRRRLFLDIFTNVVCDRILPSVLWRCWLGGKKGIRPVKNWVVGCWHGYLSGTWCRLAYGPLTVSCFSKIQIGFTFLVPAHPGSPGQRAIKRMCVCVCVCDRRTAWQASVCSVYHIWQYANDISDRSDWTFRNNVQLLCLSTSVSSKVIATVINVTVTLKYCTIHEYIAISVEMRVSL